MGGTTEHVRVGFSWVGRVQRFVRIEQFDTDEFCGDGFRERGEFGEAWFDGAVCRDRDEHQQQRCNLEGEWSCRRGCGYGDDLDGGCVYASG